MSNLEISGKATADADSDYDSAEDADFRESDDALSNSCSEEEEDATRVGLRKDKDLDSGDEATITQPEKRKKKKRKPAATDDLILTRAQKRAKSTLSLKTLSVERRRSRLRPANRCGRTNPRNLMISGYV